ncbi:hypothetical protein GGS23DRAFT_614282 [Durotheca rogersii]|uniref:uncharacterized protein n=1 Tax=Durotheca rogersii TaxID=419775 RepID=UPI0022205773|nr:uncharacterized protein GGS23DRAFT_614282 [Durotheca rogersii]KAI5860120.1 hypothetical protein GGS23DRAFT_614282 [Durotheca rogersii]
MITTMRMGGGGRPRALAAYVRLRHVVAASLVCLALYCVLLAPSAPSRARAGLYSFSTDAGFSAAGAPALFENRSLTGAQCRAAFPGLTWEIEAAAAKGAFAVRRRRDGLGLGPTVARVRAGRLYVVARARRVDLSRDMLQHRAATLHQVARALLTAPAADADGPLPDTVFAFNHADDPVSPSWSYARAADPAFDGPRRRVFPIPHFSFYAWPIPTVGSFARAAAAISRVEAELSSSSSSSALPPPADLDPDQDRPPPWWAAKIPKAVWRGTTHFNHPRAGRMRQDLVAAARGAPWADVEPLAADGANALPIEDFCRYRYVVHTEGVTYSGRFQLHQLCASVVLSPPIAWMQHLTHLARPVLSYDLLSSSPSPSSPAATHADDPRRPSPRLPYPAPWVRAAWPPASASSSGPSAAANISTANMIFVAPDWSDLAAVVAWLEAHPAAAAAVAARQRALFHDAGYLSPAAEACYWRALIRAWARVARYEGGGDSGEEEEGVPWEELSLTEVHR